VERPIDRATPEDLVSLATDVGPAPMQVGALLVLDPAAGFEPEAAMAAIGRRITAVPRLRQVLCPTPVGGGRRIWVDDDAFTLTDHVVHRTCPAPGDEAAVLAVAAVGGALQRVMAARGEQVDELVVSVPVSARTEATATDLGNDVGVVPITIATAGDPSHRLDEIARSTRAAKQTPRGASTAVIGPLFRLLAGLGLFRWFINRQRMVHTFTTNVRGPAATLAFLGSPIIDAVPFAVTTGNVTLSFAALSYAGTLAITIIADVDACPDLDLVRDSLRAELGALGIDDIPGVLGSGDRT